MSSARARSIRRRTGPGSRRRTASTHVFRGEGARRTAVGGHAPVLSPLPGEAPVEPGPDLPVRAVAPRGQPADRREEAGPVDPVTGQDHRRHALALTGQPEQEVLGPDGPRPEGERLAERQLEGLLGPRGHRDAAPEVRHRRLAPPPPEPAPPGARAVKGPWAELGLDPLPDRLDVDADRPEGLLVLGAED